MTQSYTEESQSYTELHREKKAYDFFYSVDSVSSL